MPLDKYQEQVVNSADKKILCLAGAGAGKSKTLLARIEKLIQDGVQPFSILALTFTHAAAADMRERYENDNPGKLIPEFRTFHSFSYSIICRDCNIREALGYTDIPDIASPEEEKELSTKAKVQCKITLPAEKLNTRKNLTRKEQWQVELYDRAYIRLLKQSNLITFDILNSEVSKLFVADDPSTHKYKQQYEYLVVDEWQDSDASQANFLFSFKDSNLMVVGDTLQCIYQFRNCSNDYIKDMSHSSEWSKYTLQNNYRSTRQICEYANNFSATYADDTYRIEMIGQRDGADVVDKPTPAPEEYNAINLDSVDDMINDLKPLSGTSAILCRANKEVDMISTYLTGKGIAHTTKHGTKIPRLIECALSDDYMQSYLASYLSLTKYGEYIRLTTNKAPDIKWFLDTYGDNPKISADSKKILKLREISTLLISNTDKLTEIKKILKVDIPYTDKDLFGKALLYYIKDTIEEIKSNELYVGTIHSVKGLEYDNVCVANVGSYSFQLDDEEMNNLFYVAITRAKNRLFIYRV
jgi:DNA helicase-2/ATP-dependent DNA helicase PcrA